MPYVGSMFWDVGGPWGVIFGDYLGLVGMTNSAGGNFHVSEVGFYSGGGTTRENLGILPVMHTTWDIGSETNVTDANFGTTVFVVSNLLMADNNRAYLGFDYGEPRPDIDAVRFAAAETDPARTPIGFYVAQSVDGLNWSYVSTAVTCSQPPDVSQFGGFGTFSMIYGDAGKHAYWRISEIDNVDVSSGNRPLWVSEVAVYSGAQNVTSTASVTTTCVFNTGTLADWLDGDSTTFPVVNFADIGTITFHFPAAVRINGLRFDGTNGLNEEFNYIHRCSLDYSDNGSDWTRAGRIAALTYPGTETAGAVVRLY